MRHLWNSYGRASGVPVCLGAESGRGMCRCDFGSLHFTVEKSGRLRRACQASHGMQACQMAMFHSYQNDATQPTGCRDPAITSRLRRRFALEQQPSTSGLDRLPKFGEKLHRTHKLRIRLNGHERQCLPWPTGPFADRSSPPGARPDLLDRPATIGGPRRHAGLAQ